MKILIVGAKGQLGHDLMHCAKAYTINALGVDLPHCDITNPASIQNAFNQSGPIDVVINAAAYTAVDQAESESELVFAVNRDGPGFLARICREKAIPLIHVSTDYVFDGHQTRPYYPNDPINPTGVYGQSKADGEIAVREQWHQHVIVRTSWLYGLQGSNFVKTMLRLGQERKILHVVDDQTGCPTYAYDLAGALLIVARCIQSDDTKWGTYHFCNCGSVTWYGFAQHIFKIARPHIHLVLKQLRPISTSQYLTPAARPAYSVLDCTSFENNFEMTIRSWQAALEEMLASFYSQ